MKIASIKRLPLSLILVVLWMITRMVGINFSIANVIGIILTVFCFIVLIFEFNKSGDITLHSFAWDLGFSILATVVNAVTITLLIKEKGLFNLYVTDYLLSAVILCDAWLSPFNTFRIALRNVMFGGGDSGPAHPG